jgi:hypothetical protein
MAPRNPVNAAVIPARVTVVAVPEIWLQHEDGSIARAWAPRAAQALQPDSTVEVFVGVDRGVNGWWDADSGLAINQRHLEPGVSPTGAAPAVCNGDCGLTWWTAVPEQLEAHHEHCLTCNGRLSTPEHR